MNSRLCFSRVTVSDRGLTVRTIAITSLIFFLFVCTSLTAQTILISGNVSDGKEPLSGVSVKIKGSSSGTMTNDNGDFSIMAVPNAVLEFTYVNYIAESIPVNNRKSINVTMKPSSNSLGEVVVIGYGSQKKENVTGAVSSIKGQELTLVPTSNLSNVLAGRLAGVFVAQGTGVPGVSSNVRVRSDASWNYSPPLFVIDGVIRDKISFDALNANDIEDITVLKDGATSSIYGARSSNGVIMVTTKKVK